MKKMSEQRMNNNNIILAIYYGINGSILLWVAYLFKRAYFGKKRPFQPVWKQTSQDDDQQMVTLPLSAIIHRDKIATGCLRRSTLTLPPLTKPAMLQTGQHSSIITDNYHLDLLEQALNNRTE